MPQKRLYTEEEGGLRWTCELCGATGLAKTYGSQKFQKHKHKKMMHPESINANISGARSITSEDMPRLKPRPCGDKCRYWTGKTVCISGNIVSEGTPKTCFRRIGEG